MSELGPDTQEAQKPSRRERVTGALKGLKNSDLARAIGTSLIVGTGAGVSSAEGGIPTFPSVSIGLASTAISLLGVFGIYEHRRRRENSNTEEPGVTTEEPPIDTEERRVTTQELEAIWSMPDADDPYELK